MRADIPVTAKSLNTVLNKLSRTFCQTNITSITPSAMAVFFVVRKSIPSTVVPASGDIHQTLMLVLERAFNRSGISGFIAPNAQ